MYKRDLKNFDQENFILEFLNIDWDALLISEDVNEVTKIFFAKMNDLIEKYTPLKKNTTQEEYKRRLKPWITANIINKIKNKNKILKKMVKSQDQNEKALLKNDFNNIKNEITRLTRNNKKDYYDRYFTKHKNNLSKTWQGIKEIINIKNKASDYPTCIIVDGVTITDPTQIANKFNEFYTSIADDILQKRKYTGNKSFKDYLRNPLNISMALYACNDVEVKNLLLALNPKSFTC